MHLYQQMLTISPLYERKCPVLCKHNYLDHDPPSLCQIKLSQSSTLFFLQLGPKGPLQMWTQEIIWYAESQFHQVLLQVDQMNFIKQQWMQKILYSELVS